MTSFIFGARMRAILAAAITTSVLSGCAGFFTGYDADNQFKCKAPPGVQCQSISGVYANAQGGGSGTGPAAPQQGRSTTGSATGALPMPAARNMGAGQPPTYSGAIRSEPTTIRTWVMSYKDTDGDIVDQTYVYMALDSGHWMIEHAQQLVRDSYAPARPTRALGTGLPSASTGLPTRPASEPNGKASVHGLDAAPDIGAGTGTVGGSEQSNAQDPASIIRKIQDAMRRANQPGSAAPSPADESAPQPTP